MPAQKQKQKQFKYPKEYVRHRLEEMIASGRLDAGGMIPSEQALADLLGVSRTPVRTVIKDMTKKGVLRQVDNRGYVVNRKTRFPENPMAQTVVLVSDFAAGVGVPDRMHGRSVLELCRDPESASWPDELLCEHPGHGDIHCQRILLYDRYKSIWVNMISHTLWDLTVFLIWPFSI